MYKFTYIHILYHIHICIYTYIYIYIYIELYMHIQIIYMVLLHHIDIERWNMNCSIFQKIGFTVKYGVIL